MTRTRAIIVVLLAFTAGALFALPLQNNENFPYRDTIVRNTQRLDNLERQMDTLQRGGTSTAQSIAIEVSGIRSKVDSTRDDISRIWNVIQWMIGFAAIQAGVIIIGGISAFANSRIARDERQDRQDDEDRAHHRFRNSEDDDSH